MNKAKVKTELDGIVGEDRVSCNPAILAEYSHDMTENEPAQPDFVVKPRFVEEVQAIMRLANREIVPVTPVVAGTNLGGLTIPVEGSIILDLKEMNRIIEVDSTEMYALIEPGVTFADMKTHLDDKYPDLIFGYALSPPYASILCNCLLDGLGNLSFRHGAMGEWINGIEAVLPNGEIVRTGSAAVSPSWFGKAPLPDLSGLFVSWQGSTGVVTKMAVQLWPRPKLRRRMFVLTYDVSSCFCAVKELSQTLIFDDIGTISWPLGKMLFGIEKPLKKDPNEPEFFIYLDISANSDEELNLKQGVVDGIIERLVDKGNRLDRPIEISLLLRLSPEFSRFAEFPMTLDFLLEQSGGGLTWVGCYGPTKNWEKGVKQGREILTQNGFPPIVVTRPMKGGHFGVLRFIIPFNRQDVDEITMVRKTNASLCDLALDLGFIPYKAPAWAVQKLVERMDPGFLNLMRNVKAMLDPNRIMNPGRWLL